MDARTYQRVPGTSPAPAATVSAPRHRGARTGGREIRMAQYGTWRGARREARQGAQYESRQPAGPWTPWGGGWLPPQPPRPGVISLRPLTPGEILGGAFAALARHGVRLATAMLLGQLGALLLVAAAAAAALALDARPVAALVPAAALATLLTCALASALTGAVLRPAVLGRPTTARALLRAARPRFAAVLGTQLLVLGAVAGPSSRCTHRASSCPQPARSLGFRSQCSGEKYSPTGEIRGRRCRRPGRRPPCRLPS